MWWHRGGDRAIPVLSIAGRRCQVCWGPVLRKRNRESSTVSNPTFECTPMSLKTLPRTLEFLSSSALSSFNRFAFWTSQFSSLFLLSFVFWPLPSSILCLPASPTLAPLLRLLTCVCLYRSVDLGPKSFMRAHWCPQHRPSCGWCPSCDHSISFRNP